MSTFKNIVIFILSVIVLVQAVLLLRSLPQSRRKEAARRDVRAPRVVEPQTRKSVSSAERPQSRGVERPEAPKTVFPVSGRIALVLDDWGYNLKNKNFITDNDFHVTLAILPFLSYSTDVAHLAHQNRKQTIIHMPMEPHHKENHGLEKNTLLTSMDRAKIVSLLDAAFVSVPYAVGINNHMGSKATEDARFMGVVLGYLKNKNLFFLDSFVTPQSVCERLTKKIGLGYAHRDIFIDNESDPAYIREQLIKLTGRSKRSGVAIGIGHDRPATIAVLGEMIPKLEQEGYKFVNLSEIVENKS